ncbi:hypothetical protein Vqi01_19540 [Micromonospora qiuiae]|uniref:DUF3099 domain-containing protein n=1 Tax=Micromonospora qiuiae TaxID=502268 RepID=A0ABQ4J9M0_9ACTN|nr:hypothetical protein [Micromonospora qiuiae]GIJ26792.1 hypothetical protein Vqi01_19540 [Micromonospora qiuiae]
MPIATPYLVPVARIRRKLVAFGMLTVLALTIGLPGWTVAALASISLAIPAVAALAGGRAMLRELLRPPGRPTGDRAVPPFAEQLAHPAYGGRSPSTE